MDYLLHATNECPVQPVQNAMLAYISFVECGRVDKMKHAANQSLNVAQTGIFEEQSWRTS